MSLVQNIADIAQAIGASTLKDGGYRLDFADGKSRLATQAEIDDAVVAVQAEDSKRLESDTARDDAKRALAALDTIIAGAPTATNAQMRTWLEQLARISKHHILATVGR